MNIQKSIKNVFILGMLSLSLTACPAAAITIGDFVWSDPNQNGIQDAGESGISNARVNLFFRDGQLADSTLTDSGGNYLFGNLEDGAGYYLEFEEPLGYALTVRDQGGNDATDSDPDPSNGQTDVFLGVADTSDLDFDAGMIPPKAVPDDPTSGEPNGDDDDDVGEPPAAQSACDHPYFPLREGATWTYMNLNGQSLVWTVTQVVGDTQNAQAVIEGEAESPEGEIIAVRYEWYCDSSGVFSPQQGILAFDYLNPPTPISEIANFNFSRSGGATIASADQFAVGNSWGNQFITGFSTIFPDNEIHAEFSRDEIYTIVSEQSINVPAGEFTSFYVEGEANHSQSITVSSGQVVTSSDVVFDNIWLAEGVGIVRRLRPFAIDQGEFTYELVSYSIP